MPNPNRMVRSTGGAARNATGKAYVKPKMAGTSAAGRGRGSADSIPKAKAKGPGKDGAYKAGDMFRSGRIVQPSVAPGKAKPKAKPRGAAAREGLGSVSGGRATVKGGMGATAPRKSAAGKGKGADSAKKSNRPASRTMRTRGMY